MSSPKGTMSYILLDSLTHGEDLSKCLSKWPDFAEMLHPSLNFLLDFVPCLPSVVCSCVCSYSHHLLVIVCVIFFCSVSSPTVFFPAIAHFSCVHDTCLPFHHRTCDSSIAISQSKK